MIVFRIVVAALLISLSVFKPSHANEQRAKPFGVMIHSNITASCQFGFDDVRIAIAWLQVIQGSLSGDQYIQLVQDIAGENGVAFTKERLESMRKTVNECVLGDPA